MAVLCEGSDRTDHQHSANEAGFADHLLSTEEWRTIPGYEGLYEVSSLGRIRSFHRGGRRIKAQNPDPDGYPSVCLWKSPHRKTWRVHRLVCPIFNGPKNALHCEIAHLDGDKNNARASNLKWVSKVENHSHKLLHGTLLRGERHPGSKLSNADVIAIKHAMIAGTNWSQIARGHGVSAACIRDIARGRSWRSVGPRVRLRGFMGWGGLGGELNPSAKLTNETAWEIRRRSAAGEPYSALVKDYGVAKGTISRIVTGHSYPPEPTPCILK